MDEIKAYVDSVRKFLPLIGLCFLLGLSIGFLLFKLGSKDKGGGVNIKSGEVLGVSEELPEVECSLFVDIGGAVANPGVYCLDSNDRVVDVVKKAGGFIDGVYAIRYVSRYLNMSLPLKDDQKIYIPYQNELSCTVVPFELEAKDEKEVLQNINSGAKKEDLEITDSESEGDCININTASKAKLMEISGVGESMSGKIIDGRPYKVLEDLKNISGVGESTYEKFLPFICL